MLGLLIRVAPIALLVMIGWLACEPSPDSEPVVDFEQRHPHGFRNDATERARARAAEYVRQHAHRAEELGAHPGLEPDDYAELTYLGMLAEATQNMKRVERILGFAPSPEQRHQANQALERADELVRRSLGASKSERASALRRAESLYIVGYCAALGIDERDVEALLDDQFVAPSH